MARQKKNEESTDQTSEIQPVAEVDETFPYALEDDDEILPIVGGENSEENSEVSKNETPEVVENSESTESTEEKDLLTEAQRRIVDDGKPSTLPMLDVADIPPTHGAITATIASIKAFEPLVITAVDNFKAGTSDKATKVKRAIETLAPSDGELFERRERVAFAKAEIDRLMAEIDEEEPKLFADVEAKLVNSGNEIWSEERIAQEKAVVDAQWNLYISQWNAGEKLITTMRDLMPTVEIGHLSQYVSKLDKPFGRKSSGTVRSSEGSSTRAPHVSEVHFSADGGNSWQHVSEDPKKEGAARPSNPMTLAKVLSENSKLSAADLRQGILDAWFAENGMTSDNFDKDAMQRVTEFRYTYPDREGNYKDIKVRMRRRGTEE